MGFSIGTQKSQLLCGLFMLRRSRVNSCVGLVLHRTSYSITQLSLLYGFNSLESSRPVGRSMQPRSFSDILLSIKEEAMMQAMQVSSPLVGSNFMSWPVIQSDRRSSCRQSLIRTPYSLTVCQLDNSKSTVSSSESSRRSLMIGTMVSLTGATAIGLTQPDSVQAAKRKPPPPPEEKAPEDEKYLSAYDAKVLANIRRKDALKAQLETQKAKAKTVRQPEQPPLDIFGQAPASESEKSQLE